MLLEFGFGHFNLISKFEIVLTNVDDRMSNAIKYDDDFKKVSKVGFFIQYLLKATIF